MTQTLPFRDVLDAAELLSLDEQVELIARLNHRLKEAARERLIADVREARHAFANGRHKPATPAGIGRELPT